MSRFFIGLLLCAALSGVWVPGVAAAAEGYTDAEQPSWFKNSFLDLRDDVSEATARGHRVLLFFYQEGCPYCEKLVRDNFHQKAIVDFTRKHFDVIAINLWGDRMVTDLQGREAPEKDFAASLRVQFTPTLLFLDEQGKVALRINGYYPPHRFFAALRYVAAHEERRQSFRDWYTRHNPAPASGKLHHLDGALKPPYKLAGRGDGKPLLVVFEQKVCQACDELFAEGLSRTTSRKLLGRFDKAVLDMWSRAPLQTPDGKTMSAVAWAKQLGIEYAPSLVFFDATGKEVFRVGAYMRPFHLQSALDYVASGAYRKEPEFQRYLRGRAATIREHGGKVDLWQ